MVDCPKCKNGMHYIGTDVEAEMLSENEVKLHAKAHYHCASCYTDATLYYEQEVTLK